MDPDPGGSKTYGSCGSGSATLGESLQKYVPTGIKHRLTSCLRNAFAYWRFAGLWLVLLGSNCSLQVAIFRPLRVFCLLIFRPLFVSCLIIFWPRLVLCLIIYRPLLVSSQVIFRPLLVPCLVIFRPLLVSCLVIFRPLFLLVPDVVADVIDALRQLLGLGEFLVRVREDWKTRKKLQLLLTFHGELQKILNVTFQMITVYMYSFLGAIFGGCIY